MTIIERVEAEMANKSPTEMQETLANLDIKRLSLPKGSLERIKLVIEKKGVVNILFKDEIEKARKARRDEDNGVMREAKARMRKNAKL